MAHPEKSYFTIHGHIHNTIDEIEECTESECAISTMFITEFGNELVTIYALHFVVFEQAAQEEAAIDVLYISLNDDLLS